MRVFRSFAVLSLCTLSGVLLAQNGAAMSGEPSQEPTSVAPKQPILRVSGGVMAGNILTMVMPVIRAEAVPPHTNGMVVMHAIIGADGHIKSLEWISGSEALREPVLQATRQWIYKPYLLNGQPTEVDTTILESLGLNGPSGQAATSLPEPSSTAGSSVSTPAPKPLLISGAWAKQNLLKKPDPDYPLIARSRGIGGTVVVQTWVGKDGHVQKAQPVSGPDVLKQAASDVVMKYVFKPYLRDGEPSEILTTVTVAFQ